jgi:transcriptional regulator with XRE-family HTH domain
MEPTTYARVRRLGITIRSARVAAGLSQERFAEACGLSARYVSNLERGKQDPAFSSITKIARGLRLKPSALLARAGS